MKISVRRILTWVKYSWRLITSITGAINNYKLKYEFDDKGNGEKK